MATGYSGTPLPQKLGIKEGSRVLVVGAPKGFDLGALPIGVTVSSSARAGVNVAIVFVTARSKIEDAFARTSKKLEQDAGLWFAWPKKSSGVATDVTEDVLRAVILPTGFVDNKVCAIDDTWSGLRFVLRKERRLR